MDLKSCLITLCVAVQLPLFLTAPSVDGKSSIKSAGDMESLRGIIIELENVLYKLKDYSRSLQEQDSFKGDSSQDFGKSRDDEEDELPHSSKNSLPLSSSSSSNEDEVSFKDAIEYLVALAKQKKAEKRDHDIPFPFKPKDG